MNDDVAISVKHLTKTFKLPHERTSSVKSVLINVTRRNKGYEMQHVLKDVSFDIKKGEFFGIVGRNGSGKSTLLKLLAGIYEPTAGTIQVNGKLTPFIELGVGFNPELTGKENVFLNGALLGFNRKEMLAMYDDIVVFAGLERFMDQKLKNYSSGMQVRLAFSISIRVKSDVLVLDEVLAVGDAAFQRKCYDHFMTLKRQRQTVVLVTHDMSAVRQYCDRAIMIDGGKLVINDNPDRVAQSYRSLFIDTAGDKTANPDRWGSGAMLAKNVRAKLGKKSLSLTVTFHAFKDIESVILGYSIYGPTGANLMESNTKRTNSSIKAIKSGSSVTIEWVIPNVFGNGDHSISVACCDQNAVEYYDWCNNAATFKVDKQFESAGMIDPEVLIRKVRYS